MSHENQALRLTGDVYLFRIESGAESRGLGPLNADVLSFQPNVETVDIPDKRHGRRGQLMRTFTDASPATGALTLWSVPSRVLSMLMLGNVVSRADTAGTVTGEEVALEPDYWTRLAHPNISAITVTSDPAGTTYVLGEDYEIDAHLGLIRAIEGGDIETETEVLVSYTYSAVTGERIEVGTELTTRARIVLKGENDSDGSAVEWEAYQAVLTPAESFDLMASEPIKAAFSLKFETPDGYDHPIRLDFPVYAAP